MFLILFPTFSPHLKMNEKKRFGDFQVTLPYCEDIIVLVSDGFQGPVNFFTVYALEAQLHILTGSA